MPEADPVAHGIREQAKKTLLAMGQYKVPLSPENYYVWFVHIAGKNEELSRAIKKIIQSGGRFTSDLNQLLYHKYLGKRRDPGVWQQAQQEVQSILREILDELLTTSTAATKYGHSLADYSKLLTDAEDVTQIQDLVKNLLQETRKMADSSSQLQKRLEKANMLLRPRFYIMILSNRKRRLPEVKMK